MLRPWILLLLSVLIFGCDQNQPQPLLRVATNQWIGYETLYLAKGLGEYQGHPIKLVQMPSGSDVIHALRNKNIEAAALTLGEAITVHNSGLELQIMLVLDFSHGADVIIAGSGISDMNSLRGKRIGMEKTAVGYVMLDAALSASGLLPGDVRITPFTNEVHEDALLTQQVEAIITFEPSSTRALRGGRGNVLFDSSRIPGRIVDVLAVRKEIVDQHRDALDRLIQGHFRALHYLGQAPRKAAAMIAPRLWISPDEALEAYKGVRLPNREENQRLLSGEPPLLAHTAAELVQIMSKYGLVDKTTDSASMLRNHRQGKARP